MKQGKDDRRLDESLRRLPEARAGEGFTRTVLARLDALDAEAEGAAPWWAPLPRLAATAALLVAAVALGFWIALPTATAPDGGTPAPALADAPPPRAVTPAPAAAGPGEEPPAANAAPAIAPVPEETPPARLAHRGSTAEDPAGERPAAGRIDHAEAARRLAELRRERERLIADLATLAAAERPTVLLGGDETVELVLDFAEPRAGDVRPASYRPN